MMNKIEKDRILLRKSIQKWQAIASCEKKDCGTEDCPLCQNYHWDSCDGCPLAQKNFWASTEFCFSEDSVYHIFSDYSMGKWNKFSTKLMEKNVPIPEREEIILAILKKDKEYVRKAQAMVEMLENVLRSYE